MNTERVNEILRKVPAKGLMLAYLAWAAVDYAQFTTSPDSELLQLRASALQTQAETAELETKVKEIQVFRQRLDEKARSLRAKAQELAGMKATLSDVIDVPKFIKLVVTEAKRVGLNIKSIAPGEEKKQEHYYEQSFKLVVDGLYVQTLVFLERLSSINYIVRVDAFDVSPSRDVSRDFVELSSSLTLKVFRYAGSRADEVAEYAAQGKAAPPEPAAAAGGKR